MTRNDREALTTWNRAVALWRTRGRLDSRKRGHEDYWRAMFACQVAGFASPLEVAFGGTA